MFELFDQLALLSSGSPVFFGPASSALAMFEAAGLPCPIGRSATDHFLHVINQEFKASSCGWCTCAVRRLTTASH